MPVFLVTLGFVYQNDTWYMINIDKFGVAPFLRSHSTRVVLGDDDNWQSQIRWKVKCGCVISISSNKKEGAKPIEI